ncbi:MAG: OmpA family protein, partial [Bacteroidota bacterium]
QVPFLCQLEKDKKYRLKFRMLSQYFYINSFEVLMLDTIEITKNNDSLFGKTPLIKFEFDQPFPKNKWITLETIYQANGTEVGMMIGNFKKDATTSVRLLQRKDKIAKNTNRVYHAFDDFSLTPLDSLEIKCDLEKNKQYIYADSIRHQFRVPPRSIQNIPTLSVPAIKTDSTPTPTPTISTKNPQLETVFIPQKTFTLANILFETGSDHLLPIAYNSLDSLVVFLQENTNFRLTITGHTDRIGDPNDNLILSQKRAKAVANYLITRGIHLSRISTQGKGESEPITSNHTSEGRKLNRRVEFELIDNKE